MKTAAKPNILSVSKAGIRLGVSGKTIKRMIHFGVFTGLDRSAASVKRWAVYEDEIDLYSARLVDGRIAAEVAVKSLRERLKRV